MKTPLHILLVVVLLNSKAAAQPLQKEVTHNSYTWVSINSNFYLDENWFVMADFHLRENDFFESNSFIFGRLGVGYSWKKHLSVAAGYASLVQPASPEGQGDRPVEHRIYQQMLLSTRYKQIAMVQRLRNEQRWQSVLVNGTKTGGRNFSNRIRYLVSFTVPVSNNKWHPQVVVADELMLQFGSQVTNKTFEQNRLFLGIRQNLSKGLSFDAGYMTVFQQRNPGHYTQSNVYRLSLYYNRPAKRNSKTK